jgi:hypothetical protein
MSQLRWSMVLLVLWASVAAAEEPCRAEGDRVSCDRAAFDALTKKIIDARAERDVAKIKLDSVTRDLADVTGALEACERRPPVVIDPPKPSALRALGPVILGTVGAVALGVSVAGDFGSSGRAIGAVVGSALVGAGVIWALP